MNKRGMVAFYLFMIAVVFFLLAMALAPAVTQTTDEARTELDCSNASISNQDKATCYELDAMSPLWIGVILGLGGIILARMGI